MRQIIFFATALYFGLLGTGCKHGNTIIVNDGTNYLEINYSGKIEFTDDEVAVETMSPDAWLKFRNNNKKFFAESNYHGEVEYKLYDDGNRVDPSSSRGKKLMADIIREMINIGFNADERIKKIYEKGGSYALLEATLNVPGDFLKGKYLAYLFEHGDPDRAELIGAAQITGKVMESAYEKAQVLKKFPEHGLQDQSVALEWLLAANTIDSDFEKAQVLKEFPSEELNDPTVCGSWIDIAKTINADFEKSQVLKTFPVHSLNNASVCTAWFDAAQTINGDFEKANTLKILTGQPLSNEQFNGILVTAGSISAEFEQVSLIKELIEQQLPPSPGPFDQLMVSVRNINADFEKVNLLKAIAGKDIETEAQWAGILQETKAVNADFEKAGILTLIAQKMPKTEQLSNAYIDAAKTIQSEMDYGKVMKAIQ